MGEEAAERLADDLHNKRSGKQRRSKRRHSTRNLTDLFEERSLRLAGARMVTELFTAAKGGRNKVLQLLDYLNDRHEICHMRGGSAREERVILHNTARLLSCCDVTNYVYINHQCTHTLRAARCMQQWVM